MATRNDVVGTLYVEIKPIAQGFNQAVQQLINNASKNLQLNVTANTQQAQNAIGQIGSNIKAAAANTVLFEEAIRRVGSALTGVVQGFGGLFDVIQRARLGFENALGETQGNALLEQIRQLAKETPFANQELIRYSQQLLGVGLAADQIIPTLTAVGDLVFNVGGSTEQLSRVLYALSQVQAVGRLIGQDARQFQDALIPIQRIIADFLDITIAEVQQLQRLGEISSETVFAALQAAGEDVAGAMQKANTTVSGSIEILRGTIETFIQDQPVLQQIFADIVEGINSLILTIDSEDFGRRIDSFFGSFQDAYRELQPFLSALADAAGSTAFTFLDVLTTSLEIFANVLDSIPEEALEAFAQFFVVMSVLKAPVALLGYVSGIVRLGSAISGGGLTRALVGTNAAIAATGTVAANSTTGLNNFITRVSRSTTALNALAAAAVLAGTQVSDPSLAGALSGAGLGASVGTAIAPGIGTAIGAIGGALTGGLLGFVNNARKEAEAFAAEMEQQGAEAAERFMRQFDFTFGGETTSAPAVEAFFGEIENIDQLISGRQAEINDIQQQIIDEEARIQEIRNTLGEAPSQLAREQIEAMQANLNVLDEEINDRLAQITRWRGEIDALFTGPQGQEITNFFGQIAANLAVVNQQLDLEELTGDTDKLLDFFNTASFVSGEVVADSGEDVIKLREQLALLGLTAEQVFSSSGPEELAALIEQNLGIDATQSIETATSALQNFNLALEGTEEILSASDAVSGITGLFSAQAEAYRNALDTQRALNETLGGFFEANLETLTLEQVAPDLENIAAAGQAILDRATAEAELTYAEFFARTSDQEAAAAASSKRSAELITQGFIGLKVQLGLTTEEFNEFLSDTGLLNTFATNVELSGGAISATFEDFRAQIGFTEDELRDLLQVQGDIDEFTQIVYTADISQALAQLAELRAAQNEILGQGDAFSVRAGNEINNEINRLEQLIGETAEVITPDTEEQRKAIDEQNKRNIEEWNRELERQRREAESEANKRQREAESLAERAKRELERMAEEARRALEQWEQSVESAMGSLADAVVSAQEGIEQAAQAWIGSIRERTQFERAVSVQTATRNAERQTQALAELAAGLSNLTARGLSEEAISSLGIDNIDDLRQVRRLVAASDAEIIALSAAVAQRDELATSLAQDREQQRLQITIQAAIVAAAQTLGFSRTEAIAAAAQVDQIIITGATDPEATAQAIVDALTNLAGGPILRT